MDQYCFTAAKQAYEDSLAAWDSANPSERGPEPEPPTLYRARLITETESLETDSGHIVAMPGVHVLESTIAAGDVFVVHADDLTNGSLWTLVP